MVADETKKPAPEEKKEEPKAPEPEEKAEGKPQEKKPKRQVSAKLGKLVEEISQLSALELSQLVSALEEKLGVSAVSPVAAAPAAAPAAGTPAEGVAVGEQTTFNVILTNAGANKISVIKAVREINQTLGLKEAKDLVEAVPKEILTGVNKKTADEAKKKLEGVGAGVELK